MINVALKFKVHSRYDLKTDGLLNPYKSQYSAVLLEFDLLDNPKIGLEIHDYVDPGSKAKISVTNDGYNYATLTVEGPLSAVVNWLRNLEKKGLKIRYDGFETNRLYALVDKETPNYAWALVISTFKRKFKTMFQSED